jgi:hypothetical protein
MLPALHTCISRLLVAVLLAAAAAGPVAASSFEIMPLAGYRAGGSFRDTSVNANRDIREHSSFGVALNLGRTADTQWELSFGRQNSTIEARADAPASAPLDLRVDYLQFGGTYFWSDTGRHAVAPYIVGGLGITRFSPSRPGLDDRIEPSLNLGLGLRVPVSRRIALRVEARSYVTLLETSGSVFCKSDSIEAACTIHARAKGLWQFEGLIGIAFRL